jgi:hypothetical protein
MQHSVPQQNSAAEQVGPLHGGVSHVPLLQNGCAPPQATLQPPQLWMSFISCTHTPLQHVSPGVQVQVEPLDELALELVLVPVVELVFVPELEDEVDVAPPTPLVDVAPALLEAELEDFEPAVPPLPVASTALAGPQPTRSAKPHAAK